MKKYFRKGEKTLKEEEAKNVEKNIENAKHDAGNRFLNISSFNVKKAIGQKEAIKLMIGYNPATGKGDVVVEVEKQPDGSHYVFLPLEESFTSAGVAWSNYVWLKLYYAQKNLSEFIKKIGKELNIPVEDRCLYIDYLLQGPILPSKKDAYISEFAMFCNDQYKHFLEEYKEQIIERAKGKDFVSYNNKGFEYRYIPEMELEKAISEIYRQRNVFANNGYWEKAKTVIQKMQKLKHNMHV